MSMGSNIVKIPSAEGGKVLQVVGNIDEMAVYLRTKRVRGGKLKILDKGVES
jgi:hypothetical protein